MIDLICTKDHRYYWVDESGNRVKEFDGTTAIISIEGGSPGLEWIDPWYLSRGSIVHQETARYDLGILDNDSIDPRIKGYIASYRKYRDQDKTVYGPENIEVMMADEVYGYAGTLDRLCDGVISDLKCGVPKIGDFFQIASYSGLCQANKISVKMALLIYLKEDGSEPQIKTITVQQLRNYLMDFHAALRWHRAKQLDIPR